VRRSAEGLQGRIVTKILKVSVWRGKDTGSFASYDVPRSASQTVLDVVRRDAQVERARVLQGLGVGEP